MSKNLLMGYETRKSRWMGKTDQSTRTWSTSQVHWAPGLPLSSSFSFSLYLSASLSNIYLHMGLCLYSTLTPFDSFWNIFPPLTYVFPLFNHTLYLRLNFPKAEMKLNMDVKVNNLKVLQGKTCREFRNWVCRWRRPKQDRKIKQRSLGVVLAQCLQDTVVDTWKPFLAGARS